MIRNDENKLDRELRTIDFHMRRAIDSVYAKALLRNAVIMGKQDEEVLLGIASYYTKTIHSLGDRF